MDVPDFPELMNLDGNWDKTCANLYDVFCKTFKTRPFRMVSGKTIVLDKRCIESEYEESFWHLVTRKRGQDRLPDFERAKRLHWIAPMLDGAIPSLRRWRFNDGKANKLYLWLEEHNYVLIFAESGRVAALVTAFHVDSEWQRKDFEKSAAKGEAF